MDAEERDLRPLDGPEPPLPRLRSNSTPWIDAFRGQLAGALRNSAGASLDHPVGTILVASASQAKPVAVFNTLLSSANLAPVFADGVADSTLPRTYILLKDCSDEGVDAATAQRALAECQRAFGASACHLVPINTRKEGEPLPADLWTAARPVLHAPPTSRPAAGLPADSPLSQEDVTRLRDLISGPVSKQAIESLTRRVIALSTTVKAARAGLQNKLRSWLGGRSTHAHSPNSSGGGGSGGARYHSGSIEAQTRQLADCAFLLGDFGTALSAYRQAASEFKGDKAWWHYAVAMELSAICLYATDGSWRDMDEAAEKASATYLKLSSSAGDLAARHATRAVILQMDLLSVAPLKKKEQATRDVAQALVDQSTQESNLCAALLLEQAALCFRSAKVPMQRKYAFYLILAGYRYISCSQRRHAVRTYASALRVYAGKGWSHIEDHVHFTLGRNCSQLGRIELALAYFLRLLRHSRQPAERQQTFMRELASILRAHPEKALLPTLPLPRFSARSIRVLLNDQNQPSGTQASGLLSAAHPLWKPLTAPLLPPAEVATGNWLTGTSAAKATAAPAPCVVGEWVFVEVDVENPMHVQLNLTDLKLRCKLERKAGSSLVGVSDSSSAEGQLAGAPDPLSDVSDAAATPDTEEPEPDLETDVQDVTLPAGRRSLVRLGVRSRHEGDLEIEGVTWTLNGVAHGVHALELRGRRLNKTRAQRMAKMYAFDQSLKMRVVHPMPLLQARIDGLPQTMLLGEVIKTSLVVSNVGQTPLCEAKLRLSQPAFCVLADPDADTGAVGKASDSAARVKCTERSRVGAEGAAASSNTAASGHSKLKSGETIDYSIVSLPLPNGELKPGEVLRLPLWVRAASLGAHSLHFVFAYVPRTPSPELKRRLCPLSAKLRVHPSLAIRHLMRPLEGTSDEALKEGSTLPQYALTLQVQNVSSSKRLQVSQISCVSGVWTAEPLCHSASLPTPLQPTEATAVYLRLAPIRSAFTATASAIAIPAAGEAASAMHHVEVCLCRGAVATEIDSRQTPHLESYLRTAARAVSEADAADAARGYARPVARRELTAPELAASLGLSLMVHWADADGSARGQLHITNLMPQLPLQALTPLPPAPPKKAPCLPRSLESNEGLGVTLQLRVDAPACVHHSFGSSPLCEVPVRVVVLNCLRDTALAFRLELATSPSLVPHIGEAATTASSAPPASERISESCFWLGRTRHAEQWLAPASTAELNLSIAASATGTFSLDGFRLFVCAWRTSSMGEASRLNPPASCATPAARTVQIVAA
jgi:tetratricopeptide (TPR) repeat protein